MKTAFLFFAVVVATVANPLRAQDSQFTGVQALANGEIALSLAAPTGRSHRIETTAELPNWQALVTFPTNQVQTLQYTDSAAPFLSARYYRATQVSESPTIAGDHLSTTNGDVVIQPRNHATFVMAWNGKMIYVDPVPTATYAGLPKADLILVTHGHSDHFSTATIDAVRGPSAQLVAPQAVYTSLTAAQKALTSALGYGQSTNVQGVDVLAVYAANSNHPLGSGNGYVLTIGGKRIYISGDTGNAPEIRALTNLDVAFICMNQPYTLTVNDATNAVLAMHPKVVYPYHYRDASGTSGNAATFKTRLGTQSGIEVRLRKWY